MIGHAADEPETAAVSWDEVSAGRVVVLVGRFCQARIPGLDAGEQLRGRHHLALVPLVAWASKHTD